MALFKKVEGNIKAQIMPKNAFKSRIIYLYKTSPNFPFSLLLQYNMYRIRINILTILISAQDRGVLEPDVSCWLAYSVCAAAP